MRMRLWTLLLAVALPGEALAAEVSFVRDVVPVLTKAGCNSGACHGAFQGRGGFRLSLLGFDPQADHESIVREARGRRIMPAAPEHSLLLRKPLGLVAHGGTKRLDVHGVSYRILRDWIAQGTPGQGKSPPRVVRIEVTPKELVLEPNRQAKLQARAVWSDGVAQDIAPWALYESTIDDVAEVDPIGTITARRPGRVAVSIRYLGQVAAVPVTVPFPHQGDPPKLARHNFIDDQLVAEWRKLGLRPAPLSSDAEFVRRVHLDLIGTLPTADEVRNFVKSTEPAKRARLIDDLLARAEYVDYWALRWGDLLRAHRRALGDKGLISFHTWLRQSLRDNRGADMLVRELVTARGNLYTNGPVAFYYVDQTPEDLAETTAQVFCGIRLQCAKCHHHPFDVWSQDDYHGLAGFFTRISRKDSKEGGAFGGAQTLSLMPMVSKKQKPGTPRALAPRVLGGDSPVPESPDPREALAAWITRKDNPYFARNIVNRYWGYLFGSGIVDPIDDLRPTNPPVFPALLDALAADFVEHGYDLKHLLRTICNSRAYQLASDLAPEQDAEGRFFKHRAPRRLPAEVLLDAINQVAQAEEKFEGMPPGTRAIALPDSSYVSYFLDAFGRPQRTGTCECDRKNRPDLRQALHLTNGEAIHAKVTAKGARVGQLLATRKDPAIVEEMYLATLSRMPTDTERESVRRLIAAAPSRKEGFEDLLWTLLNCAEFSFNH